MAQALVSIVRRNAREALAPRPQRLALPIATKLILSYLTIIAITIVVFSIVGTQLVGKLIVAEAQTAVRNDLNSAREILHGNLNHINDLMRLTADKYLLKQALLTGNLDRVPEELTRVREAEHLDILALTDRQGIVKF